MTSLALGRETEVRGVPVVIGWDKEHVRVVRSKLDVTRFLASEYGLNLAYRVVPKSQNPAEDPDIFVFRDTEELTEFLCNVIERNIESEKPQKMAFCLLAAPMDRITQIPQADSTQGHLYRDILNLRANVLHLSEMLDAQFA